MDEPPDRDASAALARHLAVAVQVAEAAIRLRQQAIDRAATGIQRAAAGARATHRTQHAADRIRYTRGLNTEWLNTARLPDLGAAWGAAAGWADIDPLAAVAATRIETRLTDLAPRAMAQFDRLRQAGEHRLDAMSTVLPHVATEADARDHSRPDDTAPPAAAHATGPDPPARATTAGRPHPADVAAASHPRPYTRTTPALPASPPVTATPARTTSRALTR